MKNNSSSQKVLLPFTLSPPLSVFIKQQWFHYRCSFCSSVLGTTKKFEMEKEQVSCWNKILPFCSVWNKCNSINGRNLPHCFSVLYSFIINRNRVLLEKWFWYIYRNCGERGVKSLIHLLLYEVYYFCSPLAQFLQGF